MKRMIFHIILIQVILAAWILAIFCMVVLGEITIDVERLADAIRQHENSYNHPYGILRDYCKPGDPDGQCRKGCIQTINKRLKMWEAEGRPGDFIAYLQKTYCPIGAANDPTGLNKYWLKGVRYFYGKEKNT